MNPKRRRLITVGLLAGGVALFAACGSAGPSVQARQTGETTTSLQESTTTGPVPTTAAPPATTAPAPRTPANTAQEPPCTVQALTAAHTAAFGPPAGALRVQKCVGGWATSSTTKGFNPPTFALYRAEGDRWVALRTSAGKLCEGQGVPPDVAPQIGCDT